MISISFWEAYSEGRNSWDKGKCDWKITLGKYVLSAYYFYLFFITIPILMTLPLIISGWDTKVVRDFD